MPISNEAQTIERGDEDRIAFTERGMQVGQRGRPVPPTVDDEPRAVLERAADLPGKDSLDQQRVQSILLVQIAERLDSLITLVANGNTEMIERQQRRKQHAADGLPRV